MPTVIIREAVDAETNFFFFLGSQIHSVVHVGTEGLRGRKTVLSDEVEEDGEHLEENRQLVQKSCSSYFTTRGSVYKSS